MQTQASLQKGTNLKVTVITSATKNTKLTEGTKNMDPREDQDLKNR